MSTKERENLSRTIRSKDIELSVKQKQKENKQNTNQTITFQNEKSSPT